MINKAVQPEWVRLFESNTFVHRACLWIIGLLYKPVSTIFNIAASDFDEFPKEL